MSDSWTSLWTVARQAPPSLGFSRQEYWSGLPFLPPGDLPDPGIEPGSPALQADSLPSEPPGKPCMMIAKLIYRLFSAIYYYCSLSKWVDDRGRELK